jgi:hypothetical protein
MKTKAKEPRRYDDAWRAAVHEEAMEALRRARARDEAARDRAAKVKAEFANERSARRAG